MDTLRVERILKILVIIDGECSSIKICTSPLKMLSEEGHLCYEIKNVVNVSIQDVLYFDIFYFIRSSDPLNQYWFDLIKKFGKKVIYEIDDNFFELQQECFKHYYALPKVKNTVLNFLDNSDVVKYGTNFLREKLNGHEHNSIVLAYPAPCIEQNTCNLENSEIVKIVFASSVERHHDMNFVVPALKLILDEFENVRIDFIGCNKLKGLEHKHISFLDYLFDVDEYHDFLISRQVDIGLAPLLDTASNRCKTNNKYREYAAHGIAGIYSNLPPYKNVKNNETGIVVDNDPELWYQAIKQLVIDVDLRQKIIKNSHNDVLKNNSLEKITQKFADKILAPLCKDTSTRETIMKQICLLHSLRVNCPRSKETFKVYIKHFLKKCLTDKYYNKLRLMYLYRIRKT